MQDVEGKVAFITGGASGLGLAMARSFTAAGMKVVIADIEDKALELARAEFEETNADVLALKVDVTSRQAMQEAADETIPNRVSVVPEHCFSTCKDSAASCVAGARLFGLRRGSGSCRCVAGLGTTVSRAVWRTGTVSRWSAVAVGGHDQSRRPDNEDSARKAHN